MWFCEQEEYHRPSIFCAIGERWKIRGSIKNGQKTMPRCNSQRDKASNWRSTTKMISHALRACEGYFMPHSDRKGFDVCAFISPIRWYIRICRCHPAEISMLHPSILLSIFEKQRELIIQIFNAWLYLIVSNLYWIFIKLPCHVYG